MFTAIAREYLASLPFDLSFQHVERELADPGRDYGPPDGAAFVASLGGKPVGCVGVRKFEPGVAELKRMYVRPDARGHGVGMQLAKAAIELATDLGYTTVRLDTVAEMTAAAHVYEALGFTEIDRYRENPLETARFYELRLGES